MGIRNTLAGWLSSGQLGQLTDEVKALKIALARNQDLSGDSIRNEKDPDAQAFTPPHLRIEDAGVCEASEGIIGKQLDAVHADEADLRSVVFVTHNSVGWGQKEDPHLERLHQLVSQLRGLAEGKGMELAPASLESLHAQADRLWHETRRPWVEDRLA